MKITLISQYYKPEMGAPQNRLYEMCVGLNQLGVDISIISGMPNYPTGRIFDEYKGKIFLKEILDGISIRRYWLFASNSKQVFPRLLNMFSFSIMSLLSAHYLRKRKNDFIIVESPPLVLGITGRILSWWSKSKLIMNISDLWPLSAKELGAMTEDSLAYKSLCRLEKKLYQKAICCLGQSQEIVDYMNSHGARRVFLFRNGVDLKRFSGKHISKTNDLNYGKLKIVYTGLLGFAQGILDICKNINFSELNAEFHIYGAGGEQSSIENYVSDNPNRGIVFHGKIHRDEIPNVLFTADCTLIPLVKNIFGAVPSKIYESMAAGVPILFSGEGEGQRIVCENNVGWTTHSLDYESLAEKIKYVNDNRDDLLIKGHNCIDCAKNQFDRPKQVAKLYAFLQDISLKR